MTHHSTMFAWLRALLAPPQPIGPPKLIRTFSLSDLPSERERLKLDAESWRCDCRGKESVSLFKVRNPRVESCLLTFRTELRSENLQEPACLELLAHLPGRGQIGSKGFHHAFQGNHPWHPFEISLPLRKGDRPDLLKLNIATGGPGTVWIRNVMLLATPLR